MHASENHIVIFPMALKPLGNFWIRFVDGELKIEKAEMASGRKEEIVAMDIPVDYIFSKEHFDDVYGIV